VASAQTLLASPLAARADPTLIGSTGDGTLVIFEADRPQAIRTVRPTGLGGRLVGVDTRPADGHLFGLTTTNDVYRIDPATGTSTLVSTLTIPFDGDVRSGLAFNPQTDRLRVLSADGQNLRINVTLGATAADSPLAYARADRNAGKRPRITAAAYTNAVAGAPTTRLVEIDAEQDVLIVQDPPNDGILTTVGPLGVDFAPLSGFAIVTDGAGVDHAWAATGGKLYTVDLATGHADPVGPIGDPPTTVVALAVTTEAPAP
jgi:hypothetical protein